MRKRLAPKPEKITESKDVINRLWVTRVAERLAELHSSSPPPDSLGEIARGLTLIASSTWGETPFTPIYVRDKLRSKGYTNSYVNHLFMRLRRLGYLRYVEREGGRPSYLYMLPNEVREKIREGLKEAIEEYAEIIEDLEARKKGLEELLESI